MFLQIGIETTQGRLIWRGRYLKEKAHSKGTGACRNWSMTPEDMKTASNSEESKGLGIPKTKCSLDSLTAPKGGIIAASEVWKVSQAVLFSFFT